MSNSKQRKFENSDRQEDVKKIQAEIDRLTSLIVKYGYGSYESMRAENQVRNLRKRLKNYR